MATFLQRLGRKPLIKPQQTEDLDADLRASLWNVLCVSVWNRWEPHPNAYAMVSRRPDAKHVEHLVERLWALHFKWAIDTIPQEPTVGGPRSPYGQLRAIIVNGPWDEALDLVDAIVSLVEQSWRQELIDGLNHVLTSENSGYRFINSELTPITAKVELESVESAIQKSSKAVQSHLASALSLLSDRNLPDYRNSIKESISAVEAACQAIAGMPKAQLGDCLKKIKSTREIHPAFEQALSKLYGYTSDADGIRHAMSDEAKQVTKSDAQFMLVSCSAFTNYLWSIAAENKITLS